MPSGIRGNLVEALTTTTNCPRKADGIAIRLWRTRNDKVGTPEALSKLTNPGLQCYIPCAKHIGASVLASFSQERDRVSDAAFQGALPATSLMVVRQHLPALTGMVFFCDKNRGRGSRQVSEKLGRP